MPAGGRRPGRPTFQYLTKTNKKRRRADSPKKSGVAETHTPGQVLLSSQGGRTMQQSHAVLIGSALSLALIGCGFSPTPPAQGSGTGGSTSSVGQGSTSGPGTGGFGLSGGTGSGGNQGAGGDVGLGTGGMPNCGQTNVNVMPEPPDILIVQDKSLSMNQDANGKNCNSAGCSKWSQVSAAMDTVVMATQTTVNWGLVFFGTDNMCGVSSTPVVPITPSTSYGPISQAYAGNMPASY